MAVCRSGQLIPLSAFCSRFIVSVGMMALVIHMPCLEISHYIVCVTASTPMVRLEVATLWAPLSSYTVSAFFSPADHSGQGVPNFFVFVCLFFVFVLFVCWLVFFSLFFFFFCCSRLVLGLQLVRAFFFFQPLICSSSVRLSTCEMDCYAVTHPWLYLLPVYTPVFL